MYSREAQYVFTTKSSAFLKQESVWRERERERERERASQFEYYLGRKLTVLNLLTQLYLWGVLFADLGYGSQALFSLASC